MRCTVACGVHADVSCCMSYCTLSDGVHASHLVPGTVPDTRYLVPVGTLWQVAQPGNNRQMLLCNTRKLSRTSKKVMPKLLSSQQRVATCVCCIDQSRARQLLNLFGRFLYYVGHVGHRRQLTSPCSICITQRTHYSCSWSMINRDFLRCKFSLE